MPRKIKGKSKSRRRRTYRKYYKKRGVAPSTFMFAPLGKTQSVNHRYIENVSLDAGQYTVQDYVFSANGMFDGNITGTGHQPLGYDELCNLFSHYCVTGSKITVQTANSSQIRPFYMAIALRGDSTNLGTKLVGEILEQPGLKRVLVGIDGLPKTLSYGFSAKRFFTAKNLVSDAQYNGSASVNPAEQAYFHVLIFSMSGQDDLTSQPVSVTINYHSVWSEPKILIQS